MWPSSWQDHDQSALRSKVEDQLYPPPSCPRFTISQASRALGSHHEFVFSGAGAIPLGGANIQSHRGFGRAPPAAHRQGLAPAADEHSVFSWWDITSPCPARTALQAEAD